MGQRLAKFSHRPELEYHFTVLDSAVVNAFALPGGYTYISRGLLAYLNSEAELAGVLGHELGHVTARHGVRQQSASMAAGAGFVLAQILVPELQNRTVNDAYAYASKALISGYGREYELQSDGLGAEYLAAAGYSPKAMLKVIGVLKHQSDFDKAIAPSEGREPQQYHGVFASHPQADTRLQQIVSHADLVLADDKPIATDQQFLETLNGLVMGDSAKQGIRRKNQFFHGGLGLAMAFPEGWVVKNLPKQLIAIAPQGAALMSLTVQPAKKAASAEAYVKSSKIGRLQQVESFSVHGLSGLTGLTTINYQKSKRPARISVVIKDGQAFVLSGLQLKDDSAYLDAVLTTAKSIRQLKSSEQSLAQPLTMKIIRARLGQSYAELAKRSLLPNHAEEQLRLLNQQYPDGELKPGQLVKVVE